MTTDHWTRIALLTERLLAERPALRPSYTWGVLHAADVARHLGISRIRALEFGVAGGNGLVALEGAADAAHELLGIEVEVHGFDTGCGLPAPVDRRDAPYVQDTGHFPMDEPKLRARLRRAQLHLGLVSDTVGAFAQAPGDPIRFISIDLDLWSSTRDAFGLLDAAPDRFLPRVLCYFDDTLGYPWGESNGERLAIRDSNEARDHRTIDQLFGMRWLVPPSQAQARWTEALYLLHVHDHPRYAEAEGTTFSTRLDLAD
jgi:hypothetical protein